jgi:hypothetical protein
MATTYTGKFEVFDKERPFSSINVGDLFLKVGAITGMRFPGGEKISLGMPISIRMHDSTAMDLHLGNSFQMLDEDPVLLVRFRGLEV